MKRIIAQTRKELTQTFRDRLTLVLALALPLAQMWLIGTAISLSVTDLRVVVRDMDQTPLPPLLAALAVSREGEQKTIMQVYVSSISAFDYLLGKILAFLIIAAAEWALTLVLAVLLFGLWFKGDPTPFLVSSFLFLFCSVAFGAMIGARIPDRAAAIQAIQNTCFLLSYLLSGFIFPVSNIPAGGRWVSYLIPARYYIEVARDTFVRGGGWPAVWYVPVALGVLSTAYFVSAWARMRHMQVEA